MWTAARLVAALYFAILGFYAGRLVTNTFPDGLDHFWFEPSIAALGLWQGWMVMGRIAGSGYRPAMGNGIRTSVQMVFFALVYYALREMFIRSSDLRYNDFGRAIVDALELFIDYAGQYAAIPNSWVVMLFGGILGGIATESAKRMWR